ncbi:MAG: hypothetical protein K1X88_25440 [Nannocystaceae bacterium]|nr:hypothetical protein [Nannocystaceae bacterium]
MTHVRHLQCRASLLAFAIATAGASIHLAIELTMDAYAQDERVTPVRCPGLAGAAPVVTPTGAVAEPSYHEAVALRCEAAGAPRCDVEHVLPAHAAVTSAQALFGGEPADHVFLRFSPVHHRVVWTVRATEAGLVADLDAFRGEVVEFAAEGVTTN